METETTNTELQNHATENADDSIDGRLLALEHRLIALEHEAASRLARLEKFVSRLFHPSEWSA